MTFFNNLLGNDSSLLRSSEYRFGNSFSSLDGAGNGPEKFCPLGECNHWENNHGEPRTGMVELNLG